MELQEGQIYTNIQLAQWFGIKVNYFNHVKEKKLLQLRQYFADYQMTNKGKIKILKVYNPIYTKRGARVKAIIHENFDRIWGTCCKQDPDIDTTRRVSDVLYDKYGEIHNNITRSTCYNYTQQEKRLLYGVPFKCKGTKGTCEYIWSKVTKCGNKIIQIIPFTQQDKKIKKELVQKYFHRDVDKVLIVKQMKDCGELSDAEAYALMEDSQGIDDISYMDFMTELQFKLGYKVVRTTKLRR